MNPLITARELKALVDENRQDVRILDVRWKLGVPDGRPAYRDGHIPGAIYVDLETELSGVPVPTEGRHPLPTAANFEHSARSWGVNNDDLIVVYDDLKNQASARAWWLLNYAGAKNVRVLNGSYRAWVAEGFPVETGETATPALGNFTAEYGHLPTLDIDSIVDFQASGGKVLDARARERYLGEIEPVDPKAGHIPGALSSPTSENVDEQGFFLTPEQLRNRFSALGITPSDTVVNYCGSGVTASHNILALTIAGYADPKLFPGSWSMWSNHDLPVETTPQN